jgi:hypothetical protein
MSVGLGVVSGIVAFLCVEKMVINFILPVILIDKNQNIQQPIVFLAGKLLLF